MEHIAQMGILKVAFASPVTFAGGSWAEMRRPCAVFGTLEGARVPCVESSPASEVVPAHASEEARVPCAEVSPTSQIGRIFVQEVVKAL